VRAVEEKKFAIKTKISKDYLSEIIQEYAQGIIAVIEDHILKAVSSRSISISLFFRDCAFRHIRDCQRSLHIA
jgi:hypothetical protein